MALFQQAVLTTAYFPPVEYFFAIAQSGRVMLEQYENYQKQSYRNRCIICTPSGPEALSVPVIKEGGLSRPVRDIRIDYSDPWLQRHTRAFDAAYNSSPFWLYYKDELLEILLSKPEFLWDLNYMLLEKLLEMVGLKADIGLTDDFVKEYPEGDFRSRIQPKHHGENLMTEHKKEKTYYQVFSSQNGFIPNLSILDLLSAEGPDAVSYIV